MSSLLAKPGRNQEATADPWFSRNQCGLRPWFQSEKAQLWVKARAARVRLLHPKPPTTQEGSSCYGDGTFQTVWSYVLGGGIAFDSLTRPIESAIVALGEFNGDGIKDLAVTSPVGRLSVLLGNGDGSFQWAFDYSLGYGPTSIAVGEFNRDGIHDLILGTAHPFSMGLWVLVGNGDATFQPPVGVNVGSTGASFVVGQLSGDGRPDIALAGSSRFNRDRFYKISVLIKQYSVVGAILDGWVNCPSPGSGEPGGSIGRRLRGNSPGRRLAGGTDPSVPDCDNMICNACLSSGNTRSRDVASSALRSRSARLLLKDNVGLHGKEYLMIGFKRILLPTDLSEESLKALPCAIELARAFDGEIFFIYVLPALPAPEADFGAAEMFELESTLRRDAEQRLDRFLKGRIPEDIKARRLSVQGHAAEEILRAADEYKVDLITIATHGLTGWRHLAFGSIAEKVVRMAKIPVLTVSAKAISPEQEMMCATLLSIPH